MYWIAIPADLDHWTKASPRNSGPLSVRSNCGSPRWLRKRSKMRTKRSEVIEVSTSMCSASRLKSSTTLKRRKRLPQLSASLMKSADHRIRVPRHVESNAFSLRESALGRAPKIQPHELVHPVDP